MREYVRDRRVWLALSGIVLLGAGLRLFGLDIQSLWNDELHAWAISAQKSIGGVVFLVALQWEGHPPGYHMFLHCLEIFGNSEVILRLPSAICGILSIIWIFLLGCRLFSWQEGLVASVLMAFSQCPIFYSQEARPYAFLILFSIVTVYYWLSIVEHLQSNRKVKVYTILVYLLSSLICCYLHYYGLYLIFLQGVASFAFYCRTRKDVVCLGFIYAALILAYVPWTACVWGHLHGPTPNIP
ncbi:MAG: glycosyltransferase family 39 protein, partial [Candidatus Omnitrophica bacterium]|nr:glycosyltransferase family 39 protein [Candidatus Omnitrophota bacterium]